MDWLVNRWNDWARHVWRVGIALGIVYGLYLAVLIEHHARVASANSQWMRDQMTCTLDDATRAVAAVNARADRAERRLEQIQETVDRWDNRFTDPLGAFMGIVRRTTQTSTKKTKGDGR